MNRLIGFSSGAIAFDKFRHALTVLQAEEIRAVELSALRDNELMPLVEAIESDSLDLNSYSYVSIHAPSSLKTLQEEEAAGLLARLLPKQWNIIVHPDVPTDSRLWEVFGERLCIENMDKRKPIGRTVTELEAVFRIFPTASFCFDIGHCRQVDPTMNQAAAMLRKFASRLKQVHISEVNTRSGHDAISYSAAIAFKKVAHLIPEDIPIIIESVIKEQDIKSEVLVAQRALTVAEVPAM
jgi:hypothetical protein